MPPQEVPTEILHIVQTKCSLLNILLQLVKATSKISQERLRPVMLRPETHPVLTLLPALLLLPFKLKESCYSKMWRSVLHSKVNPKLMGNAVHLP